MKTYCPKPFASIRMDTNRSGCVRFRPCCHYQHAESDLDQYLSGSHLAHLQQHMLTQETLPAGCNHCAMQEQQGMRSLRQIAMTEATVPQTTTQIRTIETFPSNVCNLACVMCDAKHSSRISQEQHALTGLPYQLISNEDATIQAIDRLSDLQTVSFIGGEFFLTKRNLEILDMIIQRKLQARIITNATVITNQLLARLQKIQDLDLMISADGLGETYELIRHPAAWHVTAQNIDILKRELPQARVHLYTVVQPLNWLNMGAFLQWANRHLLPVTLTNLQDPAWLSWSILDQQERQRFADAEIQTPLTRSQTAEIANFRNLIRNTSYQETLRQQFENNMSALLAHRNIPYSMVHQASGITLRKH